MCVCTEERRAPVSQNRMYWSAQEVAMKESHTSIAVILVVCDAGGARSTVRRVAVDVVH